MQGFGCLFLTAWGVGCVCGSAAAMTILASVDIFLLIFAIPPVIGSLYFGMKESEEEFAAYVAMISAVGYIVNSINNALNHFSQAGKLCMYMKNIRDFMKYDEEKTVENAVIPSSSIGEIMFENGEIIEKGTHKELMEQNGQYAEMFRCQAKYYQQNFDVIS